jgi:hypothetical protein
MPTWLSKICNGSPNVESITFTRQDTKNDGQIITSFATYVPGADEKKPADQWTQQEIDAIGDRVSPSLDAELERLKTYTIQIGDQNVAN